MKTLKNAYKQLLNSGLRDGMSTKEIKRTVLINSLCLLGFIFYSSFIILDLVQQFYTPIPSMIAELIVCIGIYKLNSSPVYKRKWLARILVITLAYLFYFININFIFTGKLTEFFYLLIMVISMVLFDNFWLQVGVLIVCIASFYIPNHFFHHYSEEVYGYANISVLFISIFFLVRQLIVINDKNETQLLVDKNLILKQKDEIEAYHKLKSDFFINLSHELRTPLTILKGYADNLDVTTHSESDLKKVNIIREQSEDISRMLTNILEFGKLDSANFTLNRQWCELNPLIDKIQGNFTYLFEKKGISVHAEVPHEGLQVLIDTALFESAINNLFTNTLKYTSPKGRFEFKVIESTSGLELVFIDDGPGISSEDLPNIFDRFYQANQITKMKNSTGIGLSYVKSIIEAHDFRIDARSKPYVETSFTIYIPSEAVKLSSIAEEKIDATERSETQQVEKRILIAEDNVQMQGLLKDLLSDYRLDLASNGEEAFAMLMRHNYDLLITDFMMPKMDGEELIRKVRSSSTLDLPIIMLTARVDDLAKSQILSLGIDAYITKPFLVEELKYSIKKAMASNFGSVEKTKEFHLDVRTVEFGDQLRNFIYDNLQSHQFSVEHIAHHFKMSKSTLNRRVKSLLGYTTKEIIIETRLQKARDLLLKRPSAKHKEIAEAVGIKNSTYLLEQLENRFDSSK